MPNFTKGSGKAVAGLATAHGESGTVTSEALTTAAGATYTLTIRNGQVGANSTALASLSNGTNTQGDPDIATVTPSEFGLVVVIVNRHASQALNGTLKVGFLNIN